MHSRPPAPEEIPIWVGATWYIVGVAGTALVWFANWCMNAAIHRRYASNVGRPPCSPTPRALALWLLGGLGGPAMVLVGMIAMLIELPDLMRPILPQWWIRFWTTPISKRRR